MLTFESESRQGVQSIVEKLTVSHSPASQGSSRTNEVPYSPFNSRRSDTLSLPKTPSPTVVMVLSSWSLATSLYDNQATYIRGLWLTNCVLRLMMARTPSASASASSFNRMLPASGMSSTIFSSWLWVKHGISESLPQSRYNLGYQATFSRMMKDNTMIYNC
jgi:hypothetical protein